MFVKVHNEMTCILKWISCMNTKFRANIQIQHLTNNRQCVMFNELMEAAVLKLQVWIKHVRYQRKTIALFLIFQCRTKCCLCLCIHLIQSHCKVIKNVSYILIKCRKRDRSYIKEQVYSLTRRGKNVSLW